VARTWKAANAQPMTVALAAAIVGAIVAGVIAAVIALGGGHASPSAAEIRAERKSEQARKASALRASAGQVTYGIAPAPDSSSTPRLLIENRSGGWIRAISLYIPVPPHAKLSFTVVGGMVGNEETGYGPEGNYYFFQFPNIPPCEIGITALLQAMPSLTETDLAQSVLSFTNADGNWLTNVTGQLEAGSPPYWLSGADAGLPNGPGTSGLAWNTGSDMHPVEACVVG
jgi:hypothetical protein